MGGPTGETFCDLYSFCVSRTNPHLRPGLIQKLAYRHRRHTLPGEDLKFSIKAEDKSDIRCTMSAGIDAGDGSMNVSSTNA